MKLSLPPALLSVLLRGSATTSFALHRAGTSAAIARLPSSFPSGSGSTTLRRLRGGDTSSSSSALTMAAERPFKTWTFDSHCETMDWSPAPVPVLSAVDAADGGLTTPDLVIVGVFAPAKDDDADEDEKEKKEVDPIAFAGEALALDEALGGALAELAADHSEAFQNGGSAGTVTPALRVASPGGGKAKRYVLLGLGSEKDEEKGVDSATVRKVGEAVAAACHEQKGTTSCGVLLPPGIGGDAALRDLSAAFHAGLYSDNRFRNEDKKEVKAEKVESVTLFLEGGDASAAAAADAIDAGAKLAKGVSLAKDIVNAPHNVLNSESLADTARRIAEESGGSLTCEILGKEECEARGMGSYLGVARGSETEPRFIHLTYTPPDGNAKKRVGVVGKGLLFDTGGYNVKTAMMELMKFDCGGAAAVLGAARAVGDLRPPGVEAHFVVAACENMIDARAVVPSDVLTASNGKTIEVLNTDAEGRLTLADALVFADEECGCEEIIELSTLTGACMISLGKQVCGVWTDDDDLAKALADVSEATGDRSWRMPLVKEYKEELKSKIADMTNLGGRYGGAITAALFLTEFVNKKKPFAHIDIAGPVWDDKTGATGFGAKLVSEWVRRSGE